MNRYLKAIIRRAERHSVGKYRSLKNHILYQRWLEKNFANEDELTRQRDAQKQFTYRPKISVVVPTYNAPQDFFAQMIDSALAQTYDNWELLLVDDASPDELARSAVIKHAARDTRIKMILLEKNLHIAGATNEGIEASTGEFISLLDHDDLLQPNALFEIVSALNTNNSLDFIYTDEDKISERGRHFEPFFKPEWSQDFMYSVNYITHFSTIRKSVLDAIGYEDGTYNGAQDWELFMRTARSVPIDNIHHIPKVLYSWRVHAGSTAKSIDAKPYVVESQRKAIMSDLTARQYKQFTLQRDVVRPGQWQLVFHPSKASVSIVATTKSAYDSMKEQQVDQLILLENGEAYKDLLDKVSGQYIVFIDRAVRAQRSEWIAELLGDAQRPDIGMVCTDVYSREELLDMMAATISPDATSLLSKMADTNIGKHLYKSARHNVTTIYGGVVMIGAEKLRDISADNASEIFSIESTSLLAHKREYRNLYNPYVKVVR